jgi:tRNA threonylcarbamoyl adenosine modification protein YeaZ
MSTRQTAAAEAADGAAPAEGVARPGGRPELILALDGGSPWVSAAVGRGGTVVAARALPQERSSTQLLALAAEALAAAGARPADLAGIVALAGPGSFTGLRVSLATALGLHQALGIPARTVPTLAAMAAAALPGGTPAGSLAIAAVDALRGEWSAQLFRATADLPLAQGEMALLPAAGLLRLLPAADGAGRAWSGAQMPQNPENPGLQQSAASLEARDESAVQEIAESQGKPEALANTEAQGMAGAPPGPDAPVIVAFATAALCAALGGAAPVRWCVAPPLAPAALRLAAAAPLAAWHAATLGAPIYSRPPATTLPRQPRLPG